MKKFIFTYEGGSMPATPEEGMAIKEKWTAWFTGLGDKVVDGGFPTMAESKVIEGKLVGSSRLPLTGYSVIQAGTFDEAVQIAKSCPHISAGGKVHVFEEAPML